MELTPQQWEKVKTLFGSALEKTPAERRSYIAVAEGDSEVRSEVERLLAHHVESGGFLSDRVFPLSPSPAEPEPGQSFAAGDVVAARFRILRFLARGGMGEVYEAEDLELHERVALKSIRGELLHDEKSLERFKREVHLARQVTHPNVCRIYELFWHSRSHEGPLGKDAVVFVAMELLEGETLAEFLKRTARQRAEDALPIALQMAAGLGAAHTAGIVHRDFKPGNVHLVSRARGMRVVITDFGLALRSSHDLSTSLSVTGTGEVLGTPAYMSPEQVEGKELTPASDVYSLGLVLYQMVTGTRPFEGSTPLSMAVQRLRENPAPPHRLVPDLDRRLETVILKCLARDPKARFQSGEEVAEALRGESRRQGSWSFAPGVLLGSLALILVILAGVFLIPRFRHQSPAVTDTTATAAGASGSVRLRPAVAVLGFKNLSRKPDAEWLSTALSETLNTELALGEKLRTIPGETVARTKLALSLPDADSYGQDTLARIRSNMNTDIVVLGSYLDLGKGSGGKVRIDLRAQETRTGNTLAVISENGTEAQVLDLILRTGAEVREKLGAGAITPALNETVRTSAPSSPEVARMYAEGLKQLWLFDSVGARDVLEKVVAEEPAYPLGHDALAQAWLNLGYEEKAKEETAKAFHLSGNLAREQRLLIEGHYREANHEWGKAVELYDTLFNFFPDNLDYGVQAAKAEGLDGKGKEAMQTIQTLRNLPAPAKDDPRIDLAESEGAFTMGDFKRAQTIAAEAEKKGRTLQAPLIVAAAQLSQCGTWERLGDYAQSVADCESARQAYLHAGDRGGAGRALLSLSVALYRQEDFKRARDAREKAAAVFKEIGDKAGQAAAMNDMAIDLSEVIGNHLAAERTFEQVMELWREVGNKPKIASTMGNIASEFKYLGNLPEASAKFREAAALDREAGSKGSEVFALRELGATLYLEGDLASSEKALNEVLEICQSLGPKMQCGAAFGDMGDLFESEGKLDQAETRYKQSIAAFSAIGMRGGAAEVQMALADLLREADRPGESEALIRQSIPVFHEDKLTEDEDEANVVLARALLAEGKSDEATRVINSIAIAGVEDKGLRFEFTLASALIRSASGKPEDQGAARKSVRALLAEATRDGYMGYEFEARLALGEIEMKSNQAEAGRRTLTALEKEARGKGYGLIAVKAAKAAKT